jgi:hypothetical protein
MTHCPIANLDLIFADKNTNGGIEDLKTMPYPKAYAQHQSDIFV